MSILISTSDLPWEFGTRAIARINRANRFRDRHAMRILAQMDDFDGFP